VHNSKKLVIFVAGINLNNETMKKNLLSIGAIFCISLNSWAGGLLTNTNQHVSFLRNPARDASIEIDAAYTNPAGLAFLPGEGFFFSINNQSAFQTRTITSTYAPFKGFGGEETKTFKGEASAAIIPSVQAAYKTGDWVISGNIAVTGGGGKATFNRGLPSFEAPISLIPLVLSANTPLPVPTTQYSVDAYMEGSSIIYGAQLGGTYSITDKFSAYAGFRMNFVKNDYVGHITNIMINPNQPLLGVNGEMISAPAFFTGIGNTESARKTKDKDLDCSQSGWGVTPVIGLDFKYNKLNIGAKYEFNSHLNIENKTKVDDFGAFTDGDNTPYDIPALLTIGAQYDIIEPVTVSVGYHHFFDSNAKMAKDKQKYINGGTNEYLAGVEWRINRLFLISAGGQITRTGVTDAYQTDLSYSLHSSSLCIGGAVNVTEKVRINIGYLYSFYQDWTKPASGEILTNDVFGKTNKTFGVGVDFRF
jgi:long-chain fatty acid transport protein